MAKRRLSQTTKSVSLAEFANARKVAERKATCAICKLPDSVRAEVRAARQRKIERQIVNDWLRGQGYRVDDLDWQTHNAGLHEQREKRSA